MSTGGAALSVSSLVRPAVRSSGLTSAASWLSSAAMLSSESSCTWRSSIALRMLLFRKLERKRWPCAAGVLDAGAASAGRFTLRAAAELSVRLVRWPVAGVTAGSGGRSGMSCGCAAASGLGRPVEERFFAAALSAATGGVEERGCAAATSWSAATDVSASRFAASATGAGLPRALAGDGVGDAASPRSRARTRLGLSLGPSRLGLGGAPRAGLRLGLSPRRAGLLPMRLRGDLTTSAATASARSPWRIRSQNASTFSLVCCQKSRMLSSSSSSQMLRSESNSICLASCSSWDWAIT